MVTPRTGRPRGRPPFIPTAEQKAAVQVLVACGFTQDEIAEQVMHPDTNKPITAKTLRAKFRTSIDRGKEGANALVARSLFKKATGNGPQSVTAAIFWLRTQAGWREAPTALELSGPQGAPIATVNTIDLSRLTMPELQQYEAILLKLQPASPGADPNAPQLYAPDEGT